MGSGRAPGTGWVTLLNRQVRVLRNAVERAVARGEIRAVDPAATAIAIFDLTRGLVARRLLTRTRIDVERDAAFLVDLIWKGVHRRKERAK